MGVDFGKLQPDGPGGKLRKTFCRDDEAHDARTDECMPTSVYRSPRAFM
jgi:hypothetical protein